ncbi:NitT/TauT family transport system substrate-binding protein [Nocardioides albertanoniae]|uniref:Thiamine pyrimidine synthase n=1 Tax=Nocardioides albertanoniae TaxID=1175486 RepID=A0A543AA04_9ACTN|nr:ABC transporter substrate-binding protein [Nocardioides albertanoniae]TQL69421.1 NitT/TauT family transport system substrate-binding protein [Nocardioides albertanoniae]
MRWNRYKTLLGLTVGVCTAAMLTACGSSADEEGGANSLTLAIASPSWNSGYATTAVSEAEGYFEDEGLDVKVQLFPSGTQVAQQVVGGGADIGMITAEPVAIGHAKNLGLTYFASYYPRWISTLEVPAGSDVDSLEDLPGSRIGVTTVQSSGGTFARSAMQLNGMNPDEAEYVPIGVGPQQQDAIESGRVDVLALWDTQYAIVENEGVDLTTLEVPQSKDIWGGGFAVTKKTLESNPDGLARFGRAIAKGFVFSTANPEAAVRDMWKLHPETRGKGTEEEALEEQVNVLKVRLEGQGVEAGRWGGIDKESAQKMVDFMASTDLIPESFPATDIYTTDLLDKINDFSFEDIRAQAKKGS